MNSATVSRCSVPPTKISGICLFDRCKRSSACVSPPIGAGILGNNKVIGVRAQPLAELFGSSDDLRADREMHLVELLQAAFYVRSVTMDKEDVQRRMSAFRSAKDVSLEAGLWGRSHQRLGKIPGASLSLCHTGPRECSNSKHINSCNVSHWLEETLNRQFSNEVRTDVFPKRLRRC